MKLPKWTYLVVFILGIGLCWYIMRGCQKAAPDTSKEKKKIDSLISIESSHTAETNHFKDSTEKVILSLQQDKDSLISMTKEYKIDIHQKGDDIQGLIDELNKSEDAKDTLRTLANCDSLKLQFVSAKGIVGAYIHANDSLQKVNDQIIASKTEITNRLSQQLTESNNTLFSVQLMAQKMDADNNKLRVSQNKKFSIGPSVGTFITNKGVGYGGGITITYTIIKF